MRQLKTYPNLKSNKAGENFILIGLILHIIYVITLYIVILPNTPDWFLILATAAAIGYIASYYLIKKNTSRNAAFFILAVTLFATHYFIAIFMLIGAVMTLTVSRHNANEKRKARVNL